ncbi:MAG: iron ABC transporter permease [Candidatus Eremiobacteraeota bacterium]|nr:iron ABC transporter permease [Candidatus Eremiobacteraeota bacterium]
MRLAAVSSMTAVALLVSLCVGAAALDPREVANALMHPGGHSDVHTIVWQLRLPRICIAALVGAALSIAGAILQGMLRNPIVDPYLTGVSAGAAAAIALAVVSGVAAPIVPALGFIAGLATAVLVAVLARRGAGIDSMRLILAGVSLSALFAALVTIVLTRIEQGAAASTILSWLAGSLAGRGWHEILWTLPYLIAGFILAVISIPALNVLRLGDTRAKAIGVNVDRAQWTIVASASLLTASAVALGGIIGFAGLIVPHMARRIVGTDARSLLLFSAILGAGFMALADAAARTLFAPTEVPIGVLLACIGVPTFLYLYLHQGRRAS